MESKIKYTNVYKRNLLFFSNYLKRISVNQGGTSSSKTYSIQQLLKDVAEWSAKPRLISIVSESFPHLKRGAMRDFFNIIGNEYKECYHNKTDNIYKINNSAIEFFSADNSAKVRGARRDILFINECNNINKETFDQLEVRTKEKIFLDFNPVCEFWAHELIDDPDVQFIKSTFLDNDCLDDRIKQSILKRKDKDPNWWRVYGLGEVGRLEGLIFPRIVLIDVMPEVLKKERHGLDFGYSNDPTTVNHVGITGENIYVDTLLYRTGMTNQDINKEMIRVGMDKGNDRIIADCAEPKSIEELSRLGWLIQGCVKGKDSIISGLDLMKQYVIHITKRSIETIKEFRNYQWLQDKDGRYLNKPIDFFNHSIDGIRYAVMDMLMQGDLNIWEL